MKWHSDIDQKSIQWLRLRMGKVTASELDSIISPLWKIRDSEGFKTFVYRKAAELYRDAPIFDGSSFAMQQGQEREDEALGYAGLQYGYRIAKMGFCESEDGRSGCSPDGLMEERKLGIEIKCPEPHTHCRYVCEGVVPKDYLAQVHGSMFVTGFPQWVFMSYCVGMPPLHIVVKRDETICAKIGEAVDKFHVMLAEAMEKLQEADKAS